MSTGNKLRKEMAEKICKVISKHITPSDRISKLRSSYGLKHLFERAIGEYVFEQEAQLALDLEGYSSIETDSKPAFDHPQSRWYNVDDQSVRALNDKNNSNQKGWALTNCESDKL